MSVIAGHTITGYAVTEAGAGDAFGSFWKAALFGAFFANLPDLDFLAGLLVGDADRFHRGPTHSLAAALVVSALVALTFGSRRGLRVSLLAGLVYASHVLLDTVAPEREGPGAGVALLWPLSDRRFSARVPMPDWLYEALALDGQASGFVQTVLSPETLLALAAETLLLAPLLALAVLIRVRRSRSESGR